MLTRLALTIAIAAATYTACDRHAGAAETCPQLASAEAAVQVAQSRRLGAWTPAECRVVDQLVAAAISQLHAARAFCRPTQPPAYSNPFESDIDPWQADEAVTPDPVDPAIDPTVAATCAIFPEYAEMRCCFLRTDPNP